MAPGLSAAHYITALIVLLSCIVLLAAIALHRRMKLKRQQNRREILYESYYRDMAPRSTGSLVSLARPNRTDTTETASSYSSQLYRNPTTTSVTSLPSAPPPAARSFSTTTLSELESESFHSEREVRKGEMSSFRLSSSTFGAPGTISSDGASFRLFPVPTAPPRTRTDRQVLLENEIQSLQAKMVWLQSQERARDVVEWEEQIRRVESRIESLKELHESDWALGLSEDIPPEFI